MNNLNGSSKSNKYIINGQNKLSGEISIGGAKNAILPILASTILNSGITILNNVPLITDTFVAIDILRHLGASVDIDFENHSLYINTKNIYKTKVDKNLACKMRCSIIFLGSLLARFKTASISFPGGCNLGDRPIDFHLSALEQLSIEISTSVSPINTNINILEDEIKADASNFTPSCITLPFASVGATQNIILTSIIKNNKNNLNNKVIIKNSAKEPEITDLILFLRKMGADIQGENTSNIIINPVDSSSLKSFIEYDIMSDRIEAGTFLCIATSNVTNNKIKLNNVQPEHLTYVIKTLKSIGAILDITQNSICVTPPKAIKNIEFLETNIYPLFPTDLQQQFTTLLAIGNGKSVLKENIFNARDKHIPELNKMGANISQNQNTFYIQGVGNTLVGSDNLVAYDLRGGASLIQAGLVAKGTSIISNANYIMRGYEKIEHKLQSIGADIKYI